MLRHARKTLVATCVTILLLPFAQSASAAAPVPATPAIVKPADDVTPQTLVNGMTYAYGEAYPAMIAFDLVTKSRGWSDSDIAAWSPFAQAIMGRESGFCPNVRRGARIGQAWGCVLSRQGTHEDSGFAQLIRIEYGPGTWVCTHEGICSSEDVIATPWNSMTAFVSLLEHSGRGPWCYTKKLIRGWQCRLAP